MTAFKGKTDINKYLALMERMALDRPLKFGVYDQVSRGRNGATRFATRTKTGLNFAKSA